MGTKEELKILLEIEKSFSGKIYKIVGLDISDIDGLEKHILENEVSDNELSNLIFEAVGAFPGALSTDKNEVISQTKDFLSKWPLNSSFERPLFMMD